MILEDGFFAAQEEEETNDEENGLADELRNDFWVLTSGLFGFSLIMKDMPLAVNILTTTLQFTGLAKESYFENFLGL